MEMETVYVTQVEKQLYTFMDGTAFDFSSSFELQYEILFDNLEELNLTIGDCKDAPPINHRQPQFRIYTIPVKSMDISDEIEYSMPILTIIPKGTSDVQLLDKDEYKEVASAMNQYEHAIALKRPSIKTIYNVVDKVNVARKFLGMKSIFQRADDETTILCRQLIKRDLTKLPPVVVFCKGCDPQRDAKVLATCRDEQTIVRPRPSITRREPTPLPQPPPKDPAANIQQAVSQAAQSTEAMDQQPAQQAVAPPTQPIDAAVQQSAQQSDAEINEINEINLNSAVFASLIDNVAANRERIRQLLPNLSDDEEAAAPVAPQAPQLPVEHLDEYNVGPLFQQLDESIAERRAYAYAMLMELPVPADLPDDPNSEVYAEIGKICNEWDEYPIPDGLMRPAICPPYLDTYPHGPTKTPLDLGVDETRDVNRIPFEVRTIYSHAGVGYKIPVPYYIENHDLARKAFFSHNTKRDDVDIAAIADLVNIATFIYGVADPDYVKDDDLARRNEGKEFSDEAKALLKQSHFPEVKLNKPGKFPEIVATPWATPALPFGTSGTRNPFPAGPSAPENQQYRRYCNATHKQGQYHTGDHSYVDPDTINLSERPDDIKTTQDLLQWAMPIVESSQENVVDTEAGIRINTYFFNGVRIPAGMIERNENVEIFYYSPRARRTNRNVINVTFTDRRTKEKFLPLDAEKAFLSSGYTNGRELYNITMSRLRTDRKLLEQSASRIKPFGVKYNNTAVYAKLWQYWAYYRDEEARGRAVELDLNQRENLILMNVNTNAANAGAVSDTIAQYDDAGAIYLPLESLTPASAQIARMLVSADNLVVDPDNGLTSHLLAASIPSIPVVIYHDRNENDNAAALPAAANITAADIAAFIFEVTNRFQEQDDCIAGYIWVSQKLNGTYYQHGERANRQWYFMTSTYEVKRLDLPRPGGNPFIFQIMSWHMKRDPEESVYAEDYTALSSAAARIIRATMGLIGGMTAFAYSMIFALFNISGRCMNLAVRAGNTLGLMELFRIFTAHTDTTVPYIVAITCSVFSQIGACNFNPACLSGITWNQNMRHLDADELGQGAYWEAQFGNNIPEMFNVYAFVAFCYKRPSVLGIPFPRPGVHTNPAVVMANNNDQGYHAAISDSNYGVQASDTNFWRYIPTGLLEINAVRQQHAINAPYAIVYDTYPRGLQVLTPVRAENCCNLQYLNEMFLIRFGCLRTYDWEQERVIAPTLLAQRNPNAQVIRYFTHTLIQHAADNYAGVQIIHPPRLLTLLVKGSIFGGSIDITPVDRQVRGNATKGKNFALDNVQRTTHTDEISKTNKPAEVPGTARGVTEKPPEKAMEVDDVDKDAPAPPAGN